MIGTNIQTITPTGWVHEQNNKKVITENQAVLAKEIGIARYERIKTLIGRWVLITGQKQAITGSV
jgi:hypothetical protein